METNSILDRRKLFQNQQQQKINNYNSRTWSNIKSKAYFNNFRLSFKRRAWTTHESNTMDFFKMLNINSIKYHIAILLLVVATVNAGMWNQNHHHLLTIGKGHGAGWAVKDSIRVSRICNKNKKKNSQICTDLIAQFPYI